MMKKINKIFSNPLFAIFLVCVGVFSPLVNKIAWGHDTSFHLTNLHMMLENLRHLGLSGYSSKIFGIGIARGFGYGTFLFYPCLSYILTATIGIVLNTFGIPPFLALSHSLLIIVFLSGISMYLFTKSIYKNSRKATICSILYITSTYLLCDVFIRTALAETMLFIFLPIIFWSLYELLNGDKYKFYLLFIIGYTGSINSHLVMSIYITIFIIILFICNLKKVFKWEIIKKLLIASIMVLIISSPYIVTLLEHKFFGNYVIFDNKTMFSDQLLEEHSLNLIDYFYIGNKTDNGIRVYFNYVTLLSTLIVIIFNKKIFTTKKEKKIFYNLLLLTVLSMFMATKYFPWEYLPTFLKNIQFPWRLCLIMSFSISAISGNVFGIFKKEAVIIPMFYFYIMITILFVMFSSNKLYYFTDADDLILYRQDIGNHMEYMPVNVINNYFYYVNRDYDIKVLNGKGNIKIIKNSTPYILANIDISNNVTLELPRIYYLGYNIKIIDKNNKTHNIKYHESDNGFIEINLNTSGKLEATYEGTPLVKISNIISLLSIVFFGITLIYRSKKKEIKK